jgi:hypothetical protein
MAVVRTHKGKTLNMQELKNRNSKTIAVGNMRVNARGDLLGKGGKIVKTKEQLANEKYNKTRTKEVNTSAPLNTSTEEMLRGKKRTPVKFKDEQAKKPKTDIETLGKFDLGPVVKK